MANKKVGRHSASANDFLEPKPPESVVGTNVGTGRGFNDGAASVAFSLPAGSPPATSYTVSAIFGSTGAGGDGSTGTTTTQGGASSPIVIGGLKSGASYTFTVTATNSSGTSAASSASSPVTITTVPSTMSAPTSSSPAPAASPNVAGASYDTVNWTPPSYTGGSAILGYLVTGSDASTGTGAAGATTVNITQSGTQTYVVQAQNGNGYSTQSASSTPATTTFSFTPYSFTPFSFTPFSFTPVYSFTPFSFTPFSFTPVFSFTPFSFTPVYSFTPFSFTPMTFSFTPKYSFVPFSFTPMYSFVPFSFTPKYSFVPFSFTPKAAAGCRAVKPYPYCFCSGSTWAC